MTIVSSLKHKNTQPLYIFNRENPQNSGPQNGPGRGLDFIALPILYCERSNFRLKSNPEQVKAKELGFSIMNSNV